MSFFFPVAFFFSVLSIAIIALYLRRNRRRVVEVPSTLFWQRVLDRQPNRRFLGRLRQPLSLLLQLLIFALLLLALAKPEFFRVPGKRSTVIVIDTRARMQVGSAFPNALAAARQIVAQAGPGEEIALLNLGGESTVLSPFSSRPKELRDRLNSLRPTDGGGAAEPVLSLAGKLLASRPEPRRMVVITDRPLPLPDRAEPILVGSRQDNTAILELAARPLPASPQTTEVFLKVGNFSSAPKDAEVELLLDGRTIDLQKLALGPGGQANFLTRLPAEALSGEGKLTARLSTPDALSVDNESRAVLDAARPLRVLLLTEGNPFLENAIKADPSVKLDILQPDQWRSAMSSGFDVTVFDDVSPPNSLAAGNALFFGKSPFDVTGDPIPVVFPEAAIPQHPLLWNVALANARFGTANRLNLGAFPDWKSQIVAESAGEPLLVALENSGGQRNVIATWSAASSNLALKIDFPLFINNALHWLAGRAREEGSSLRAGETYAQSDGVPLFLAHNGFYPIDHGKQLAVNTSDEVESDLRLSQSSGPFAISMARFAALQFWQWLAGLALLLILLEWWLHHRRITE
jgi:Aerotolerance regulator N-terminal/von Willebrand factor type A domain